MNACTAIENNGLAPCFPMEIEKESVVWNGREITHLKGEYDCSLERIALCSKSRAIKKSNHGRTASGFAWIAGGVALLFIPLPGARAIGLGLITKGATTVSGAVMTEEARKRDAQNREIKEKLKK